MLSHLIRPLVLLTVLAAAGCGGGPRPAVEVIGVTDAQAWDASRVLLVFLEVHNPTKRTVKLSRLDYRMEAEPWFDARGRVSITRSITAGGSAVIEVPVRLDRVSPGPSGEVSYRFDGTLSVRSANIQSEWPVSAKGELSAQSGPDDRSAYIVVPTATARE